MLAHYYNLLFMISKKYIKLLRSLGNNEKELKLALSDFKISDHDFINKPLDAELLILS